MQSIAYTFPTIITRLPKPPPQIALDCLIKYDLRAKLLRRQFWTLSVWKDRASANAFVVSEPHATAVGKFQKWAGRGAAFVHWNSSDGTIDWNEALQRLENPTFYYRG